MANGINPVAWAGARLPSMVSPAASSVIQAGQVGRQEARAQQLQDIALEERQTKKDKEAELQKWWATGEELWSSGDPSRLGEVAMRLESLETGAGEKFLNIYGQTDRTRFVGGAYNILAASAFDPPVKPETGNEEEMTAYEEGLQETKAQQDAQLTQAIAQFGPMSPMGQEVMEIRDMPMGPERDKRMLWAINEANRLKAFGDGTTTTTRPGQKGKSITVRDDDSKRIKIVTPIFDPNTNKMSLSEMEMPENYTILNYEGLSPEERKDLAVQQEREKAQAKQAEARAGETIQIGVDAARSMAGLRRGIELLADVKTGGLAGAITKAKQYFGIEGADEGELSFNLSKAVLSQLKATFGAAFTAEEGRRLERISAGIGKSPEANLAILQQSLAMAENAAYRAIARAEAQNDMATANEIRQMMTQTLTPGGGGASPVAGETW